VDPFMSRWYCRSCPLLLGVAAFAAPLLCGAPAAARTISGVCPDGSIFIVQRAEAIPCSDAKQVEPHEMPPLNPELLPRPYGWERFNQETDPNNPYNIVDSPRPGFDPGSATPAPPLTPKSATQRAPTAAGVVAVPGRPPALPPVSVAAPSHGALDLGLSAAELRDLASIVEMMQEHAPAGVVRRDAAGTPLAVVRIARSTAFDARVREALQRRGAPAAGPVVLFDVVADREEPFYGNFTFVQGHVAFHPDTSNPEQVGLLEGELGAVGPSRPLLGYVVLPAHVDLARPLDIYWNDFLATATLRP
jgi:hypothetical protein